MAADTDAALGAAGHDDGGRPAPARGPTSDRHRRRRRLLLAGVVLVVLVTLAGRITLPYYAVAPGGTFDTGGMVQAPDGESFPPSGTVAFPTVSTGRTTILEALAGWIDPDVDVREEEQVVPAGADADQLRRLNLGLMARSKDTAVAVAFQRLGHDVVRGEGAQVVSVFEGAPAEGRLAPGEVVVEVDGRPVELHSDLVAEVRAAPGDRLTLTVRAADGTRRPVEVHLAEHPENAGQAFLGVTLTTAGLTFDLPFDVAIDSLDIGGPSAGLLLTLRVLDLLTEGELTGGRRYAATGTIDLDGTVGDVGGVRQKAATVRDAGYDVFLVPERDVETARAKAGDVLVIGVGTLDDALAALVAQGGDPLPAS